jgi:hypothetical protein
MEFLPDVTSQSHYHRRNLAGNDATANLGFDRDNAEVGGKNSSGSSRTLLDSRNENVQYTKYISQCREWLCVGSFGCGGDLGMDV